MTHRLSSIVDVVLAWLAMGMFLVGVLGIYALAILLTVFVSRLS